MLVRKGKRTNAEAFANYRRGVMRNATLSDQDRYVYNTLTKKLRDYLADLRLVDSWSHHSGENVIRLTLNDEHDSPTVDVVLRLEVVEDHRS